MWRRLPLCFCAPVRPDLVGVVAGLAHLLLGGAGDAADDVVGGGVVHVDPLCGRRLAELAVDEVLHRGLRGEGGMGWGK